MVADGVLQTTRTTIREGEGLVPVREMGGWLTLQGAAP